MQKMIKDIGIDLGTANTLVFVKNKGIAVNEPSVVAFDVATNRVLAVGNAAKRMIGRTPSNILATRPMKNGVIADFETTKAMLKYFISRAYRQNFFNRKPRIIICIPSGATEVERRAVVEAAISAGAKDRNAFLIEEPMAAAIGVGLPVAEASGSMVVDIGGGTSDVAVISLGGIVTSQSLRIAGDKFDDHIVSYVKKEHKLAIGERTAEELKMEIGCVYEPDILLTKEVTGRDVVNGLPKTIKVSSKEMSAAIIDPAKAIVNAVKATFEQTPPELASDIMTRGIMLTGGGALLSGLDKLIASETGLPVYIADNPLKCVAVGTGMVLENIQLFHKVFV